MVDIAMRRHSTIARKTSETDICVSLTLDGQGTGDIRSGLGFFDHMLTALARHAAIDLTVECTGDLHVDDHHTVEDVAIALGQAFDEALSTRAGLRRFGHAYAPLDESLVRTVIDFSGRPGAWIALNFLRPQIGDTSTENLTHFFQSFAIGARCTLHVDQIKSQNDHHLAEAAFKSFALAVRQAVELTGHNDIPSTKGSL
jgi:imidazoleglycerol phosphate dehydratase HisB